MKYLWKARKGSALHCKNAHLAFKSDVDTWSIKNPDEDTDWLYAMTESDYKETIAHFGIMDIFEKEM